MKRFCTEILVSYIWYRRRTLSNSAFTIVASLPLVVSVNGLKPTPPVTSGIHVLAYAHKYIRYCGAPFRYSHGLPKKLFDPVIIAWNILIKVRAEYEPLGNTILYLPEWKGTMDT